MVEQARAVGFDLCGVASVEQMEASEELARLPEWLERGYAGEMRYLHDPRRASPARLLKGARSLIVCARNYNTALPYSTEALQPSGGSGPRGWISRYAWGEDYHKVLGEKLDTLITALRPQFAEPFDARARVDTGPVLERVAAKYAGLGWPGKNTLLLNERLGSWLFLGVIVTTLNLQPSLGPGEAPPPDLCGNCRLCLEACPTGAIIEPYVLDARRCISYLTIELRGGIPEELRQPMGRMVFGCDICQDVCPWNRAASVTSEPAFLPRRIPSANEKSKHEGPRSSLVTENSLFSPALTWLVALGEDEFREIFRSSAVKRAKWRGMLRNVCVALGNSGLAPSEPVYAHIRARLAQLAQSDDALIAEHARWALDQLRSRSA